MREVGSHREEKEQGRKRGRISKRSETLERSKERNRRERERRWEKENGSRRSADSNSIVLPHGSKTGGEGERWNDRRRDQREKGRRFIGITMKLRDTGVNTGEIIVTGVVDRTDLRCANGFIIITNWSDRFDITVTVSRRKCNFKKQSIHILLTSQSSTPPLLPFSDFVSSLHSIMIENFLKSSKLDSNKNTLRRKSTIKSTWYNWQVRWHFYHYALSYIHTNNFIYVSWISGRARTYVHH